jgi:hypothetical protein
VARGLALSSSAGLVTCVIKPTNKKNISRMLRGQRAGQGK